MERKCYKCKGIFLKSDDIREYNGHPYHEKCLEEKINDLAFRDYIQEIFGTKAEWGIIQRARKNYKNKGLDDVCLLRTLKYIHEIKKIPTATSNLFLIPSMYREAEDYWDAQEAQEKRIAQIMSENLKKEREIRKVITINRGAAVRKTELLSIVE